MEFNLINTGLKTMAMLFIVIALLILILYFIKRFLFQKRGTKGDLFIEVISSMYLSPKERIEVIEISGERIVLGITPGHISFLTKLNHLDGKPRLNNGKRKDDRIKGS